MKGKSCKEFDPDTLSSIAIKSHSTLLSFTLKLHLNIVVYHIKTKLPMYLCLQFKEHNSVTDGRA